jgi:SPP1 gp7 family putative phage head morphogenesis protein
MRQAFDTFAGAVADDVRQMVQAGIVEGRTTQQISRDARKMVETRSRRQADALVRTITNHVGNQARESFYRENSDLIEAEEYVATLDARTTLFCAGEDGKVFPIGQGPMPPTHYNCRSVRVAVLKKEFRIPTPNAERASVDGPVNASRTYSGWLKDQSAEFQNEVLGPERARLFRSGEVALDRFTDDIGRVYTLDELRAREGLTLN